MIKYIISIEKITVILYNDNGDSMKVKIPKCNSTSEELLVYDKPKIVYIPLISGNDTNITILVNKGEYVYKGSMIAKRKGDFRIPIHSSVSGTVLDFEEKTCFNGTKVKCVAIENDFQEKYEENVVENKNISKYSKEEFINILRDNGIVGMGGAGFPTYVKYDNPDIKTLIVNAVECEPYITADYMIASKRCEEILETIDAILEINRIEEAIIVIKESNETLKKLFDDYVGTYLKIKVKCVNDYYPAGWEKNIIKDVLKKEYINLPIECGVVVNNISTIYAIYEALKYNKPLVERIITFAGDTLNKSQNIMVKIGTPVSEIMKQLNVDKNKVMISGGPMMGNIVYHDLVISANQNCILFLNKEVVDCSMCIRCGKCTEVCPVKLSPVTIMKQLRSKKSNVNKLNKLQPLKCIECGLCSYICPAKLNLREEVKKAKSSVKGVK